jgi:hypothetical protein
MEPNGKVVVTLRKVIQEKQYEPTEFTVTVELPLYPDQRTEDTMEEARIQCIDGIEGCFSEWFARGSKQE